MIWVLLLCALAAAPAAWFDQPQGESRAHAIARQVRERDTGRDSRVAMRMTLVDRRGRERQRALIIRGLRGGPGRPVPGDRTLLHFTLPNDIRGTGFLVWEHPDADDERFLYLPSLGRVRRIAGSEAQESFVGSDFTYEDIGGRQLEDYTYTLLSENETWTAPDGSRHAVWRLESKSRKAGARFPRIVSLVRKDLDIVVHAEIYNRRNEKQKTFAAKQIEKIGRYWTVTSMTMSDALEGTRTDLVVEKAEYNVGLGPDDFSRVQLERGIR
ncbi:MAG TPA: outer membrane lipoprotein-sorting protein [Vicinamibacterales bacterium]|nr:outer membrane lipoprotein-sorting protein [Vicinamibacterales bacterium]